MDEATEPTVPRRAAGEPALVQARDAYERYAVAGEHALDAYETAMAQVFEGWRMILGSTRETAHTLADSQVAGARRAREEWTGANARFLETVENGSNRMLAGFREIGHRILVASDTNLRASLDFAERLSSAATPQAAMQLQADFVRDHVKRLTEQVVDLHQMTARLAREAADRAESR